jgi:hypothetical protein
MIDLVELGDKFCSNEKLQDCLEHLGEEVNCSCNSIIKEMFSI